MTILHVPRTYTCIFECFVFFILLAHLFLVACATRQHITTFITRARALTRSHRALSMSSRKRIQSRTCYLARVPAITSVITYINI